MENMSRRFGRKIFSSKIHRTSFFVYLSIFIVFALLMIVLYGYLVYTIKDTGQKNQMEITDKTNNQIQSFLLNMDSIALQTMGNSNVLNAFEKIKAGEGNYFDSNITEKKQMQKTLMGINGPNLSVGRISIYNQWDDYVSYGSYNEDSGKIVDYLQRVPYEEIMSQISAKTRKRCVIKVHEDTWCTGNGKIVSLYRPLRNIALNKNTAIIETQMKLERLYELIGLKEVKDIELQVFDEYGEMIYPDAGKINIRDIPLLNEYDFSEENSAIFKNVKNSVHGEKELYSVKTGEDYKWTVVTSQEYGNMMEGANNFLKGLLLTVIAVFLLMAWYLFIMSKRMTGPLIQLNKNLNDVTLHNLTLRIKNKDDLDVVDSLNEGFNLMFDRLGRSIENEMNANFLALQAQMNPHFLYNVLSVIGAAGIEEDGMKVVTLCDKLSNMLRYSSSYEYKIVSLKEEEEYAGYYLDLMKIRYEDKFSFEIVAEGNLEEVTVPKIFIQPMLENCFKHAFRDAAYKWNILVSISVSAEEWNVMIKDNGNGFTKSILDEINKQVEACTENIANINHLKVGGLGLVNTIIRLKLLYGKMISYEIYSDKEGAFLHFRGKRIEME